MSIIFKSFRINTQYIFFKLFYVNKNMCKIFKFIEEIIYISVRLKINIQCSKQM